MTAPTLPPMGIGHAPDTVVVPITRIDPVTRQRVPIPDPPKDKP